MISYILMRPKPISFIVIENFHPSDFYFIFFTKALVAIFILKVFWYFPKYGVQHTMCNKYLLTRNSIYYIKRKDVIY